MEEIKRNRLIIVVATAIAILLIIDIHIDAVDNVFSSEKWLNNPEIRLEMTDEIVRTGVLMNKSYNEIVTQLGQPTGMGKPDSSQSAFMTINYFLGAADLNGMSIHLCLDLKQDSVILVYKFFSK